MPGDADSSKSISGPQDPHVEQFRPKPDQAPQTGLTLNGFLGDSDRPGHRRLYFTATLDYYIEFKTDDVVTTASIPPERFPFPGSEATQITLRKDAVVSYTRTSRVRAPDGIRY